MSKKTMIEVSDVTMQFRLNNDRILSLKEFVTTALRGKLQYNNFTALEHVSFTVKKGETLFPRIDMAKELEALEGGKKKEEPASAPVMAPTPVSETEE